MFIVSLNCVESSRSQLCYYFKLHTSDFSDKCHVLCSSFVHFSFSSWLLLCCVFCFLFFFFISLPQAFFRSGVGCFLMVKMLSDQNGIQICESPHHKTSWFVSYYSSCCCWRQKVCQLLFSLLFN